MCIYTWGGITCGWFKASTEGPGVYTLRIKEETLSKHYEFQPPKAQRTGSGGDWCRLTVWEGPESVSEMKGAQSRGQSMWGTKSWESLGEERVEGTSHGRAWHRTVEFLLNDGQPFRRDSTFIHSGQSMDRGTESSSEAGTKPSVIRKPGRGRGGVRCSLSLEI